MTHHGNISLRYSYHHQKDASLRVKLKYYFLTQSFPDWNNLLFQPDLNRQNYYTCRKSVISPAPSVVNNFTVISYELQHDLEVALDLSWYPPSASNGNLAPYNICVGEYPLRPDEEVQPHAGHFCENAQVRQNIIKCTEGSIVIIPLYRCKKRYIELD